MALLETFCLISVVCILLYFWITKNHSYWEKRNIPYEKPLPIVGNFLDMITVKRNLGQIIADVYVKHKGEKVVGMFNFMRPALMIRDPVLVTQILTTDFHNFADNDFEVNEELDPVLAKNLFVQRGEKWKRNRQALSPAFTVGKIKSTYEKIEAVAEKLIDQLKKNPESNVKEAMSLYTSEIVASWGIGIDGHSFDTPDPILPRLGKMIFEPGFASSIGFAIMTFSPTLAKLLRIKLVPDEVPNFFDTMLRDLINARNNTDGQYKDFLQYFVDLKKKRMISRNDDQHEVTDDDIVSGLVSFFIEGYETSASILSLLLYHLVKNPPIQKKLQEEVDELFRKENGKPSFDSLIDLPYLAKIYSETVRLHNGLSMSKQCTQTCSLNIGDGKSVLIEKGTGVIVSTLGLHTDPEYWQDPHKFDPERFAEDKRQIKGTYIPFGDGPRICIGMRIASAMIKTAAIQIVRNFDLLPNKKTAPEFVQDPAFFLPALKGGIYMRFAKRH